MLIAEAELWAFARDISYLQVCLHSEDTDAVKLYTGMGFSPETTLFKRYIPRESSPLGLPRIAVRIYPYSDEWRLEGERTTSG